MDPEQSEDALSGEPTTDSEAKPVLNLGGVISSFSWLRKYWPKLLVIGVGLVAVIVGGKLGIQAFDAQRDPVPVVETYLDAIARGDATEANLVLDPSLDLGDAPYLSDAALGAAVERIEVTSVKLVEPEEEVEGPAETATVRAKFTLAGETYKQNFTLEARDQGLRGPDEWKLKTPLVGLSELEVVPEVGESNPDLKVDIGGIETTLKQYPYGESYYAVQALYPAVYEVKLDAGQYFETVRVQLQAKPISEVEDVLGLSFNAVLGRAEDKSAVFKLPMSKKMKAEMLAQGLKFAETCAQNNAASVDTEAGSVGCPRVTWVAAADACLADPLARRAKVDNWSLGCDFYRDHSAFRGPVTVEAVKNNVTLTDSPSAYFTIGTYRFTEVNTGRVVDIPLQFGRFEWVKGKPTLMAGGLYGPDE